MERAHQDDSKVRTLQPICSFVVLQRPACHFSQHLMCSLPPSSEHVQTISVGPHWLYSTNYLTYSVNLTSSFLILTVLVFSAGLLLVFSPVPLSLSHTSTIPAPFSVFYIFSFNVAESLFIPQLLHPFRPACTHFLPSFPHSLLVLSTSCPSLFLSPSSLSITHVQPLDDILLQVAFIPHLNNFFHPLSLRNHNVVCKHYTAVPVWPPLSVCPSQNSEPIPDVVLPPLFSLLCHNGRTHQHCPPHGTVLHTIIFSIVYATEIN